MEILRAQFELTPEDLIPVIENVLERDPFNNFLIVKESDLYLEIPLVHKMKSYTLPGGRVAQASEGEKQKRPEFSRIMFFNRAIGYIQITQTSSYPTKSVIIITGNVKPENDQIPKAIDSDSQAEGVLHRLASGLMQILPATLSAETVPVGSSKHNEESNQFKLPKKDREDLVNLFRSERAKGKINNKGAWAEKHGISYKTLKRYEDEFPE